jgi:hypothetical protein
MRMRLVLFGRGASQPALSEVEWVRAVFSIAIHESREKIATDFQL